MAEDDYDQFYKVDFFGGGSEVGYDGFYGGSTKRHLRWSMFIHVCYICVFCG